MIQKPFLCCIGVRRRVSISLCSCLIGHPISDYHVPVSTLFLLVAGRESLPPTIFGLLGCVSGARSGHVENGNESSLAPGRPELDWYWTATHCIP